MLYEFVVCVIRCFQGKSESMLAINELVGCDALGQQAGFYLGFEIWGGGGGGGSHR